MENCKLKDNLGIESAAENANVAPLAGSGTDTSATQTTKEANENQLQNTQLQSQLPENGLSNREAMRIDAQNWVSDTMELDIFNATGQGLLEEVIEAKFKDAEENYLVTEEIIKIIQNSSTQPYMRIKALVFLKNVLQLERNGELCIGSIENKSAAIHEKQLPRMIKVVLARIKVLSEKDQPSEIEQRELANDLSLLYEAYTTYIFNESQVQSTLDVLLNVYKQKQIVTPEIAEQIKNFCKKMASLKDIKPAQAGNLSDAIIAVMQNKNMQNIDDELSLLESVFTSLHKDNKDLMKLFEKIHSSQRTQEDIDVLLATISSLTESLKVESQSLDIKKGNALTTNLPQENDLENIIPILNDDHANANSQQAIHENGPATITADQNNKCTPQVDFIKANNGTITECGSKGNNCFFFSVGAAINGKTVTYDEAENLRSIVKSEVDQKYQDLCRYLPNQIRQFIEEKTEKLLKPIENIEKNIDLSVGNCPVNKDNLNDLLKGLGNLLNDVKNNDSLSHTLNDLDQVISKLEHFKDKWKNNISDDQNLTSLKSTLDLLQRLKDLRSPMQRINTTRKERDNLNSGLQIDPTGSVGSWVAKYTGKTLIIFPQNGEYKSGQCRFFASNGRDAGIAEGGSLPDIMQNINEIINGGSDKIARSNNVIDLSNTICLFYSGNGENGHYQLVQFH